MGRRGTTVFAVMAVAAVALGAGCRPRPTEGWRSTLVTMNAAGTDSAAGASTDPVFSPDGTKLAFVSYASDLPGADDQAYPFADIFVKDLVTGVVALVSRSATGTGGGNEASTDPVFSPDGTKLAFVSSANDLGPQDTDRFGPDPEGERDVYVHDLASGDTSLVSANATGTDSGNWPSFDPMFDPTDSNRLVFTSRANNLGPLDSNGAYEDIYVRDLAAGTTSLISVDGLGVATANGWSTSPALSANGRKIAFYSTATNLIAGRSVAGGNVFVRDLDAGVTTLVSQDPAGNGLTAGGADSPAISPDGRLVAFTTYQNNLGPADEDRDRDVYVRDVEKGENHLVSTASSYHADLAVFSPDGSTIAYTSGLASVRHRSDGSIELVNAADTDTPAPSMEQPAFSPDGRRLAFSTMESLDPRDDYGLSHDVYLLDLDTGEVELVSAGDTQESGSHDDSSRARPPVFSPDGGSIAYESRAGNLDNPDTNGQVGQNQVFTMEDVFIARFVGFETTDMAVTMTTDADGIGSYGVASFHLVVSNDGEATAENVKLVHALPYYSDIVDITTSAGTCVDPNGAIGSVVPVTCQFLSLEPGDEVDVTVRATIGDPGGTALHSAALVTHAPTLDSTPANDAAVVNWTVGPVPAGDPPA